jgi:hypothetical protein
MEQWSIKPGVAWLKTGAMRREQRSAVPVWPNFDQPADTLAADTPLPRDPSCISGFEGYPICGRSNGVDQAACTT